MLTLKISFHNIYLFKVNHVLNRYFSLTNNLFINHKYKLYEYLKNIFS